MDGELILQTLKRDHEEAVVWPWFLGSFRNRAQYKIVRANCFRAYWEANALIHFDFAQAISLDAIGDAPWLWGGAMAKRANTTKEDQGYRLPSPGWIRGPLLPHLSQGEVHVWCASLRVPTACMHALGRALSEDEKARAARFVFEKDRDRYIVSRGILRDILARYLQMSPGELRFCYGRLGKPSLVSDVDLRFNLSHSEELALYAVAEGSEVGVDLETVSPRKDLDRDVTDFFSEEEAATIRAIPEIDRLQAFYLCWTRKEAYLKAKGCGLSLPLGDFSVPLDPGTVETSLPSCDPSETVGRWTWCEVSPGPCYAASLALKGHGWRTLRWNWSRLE
jgi:4'-phosphopantetheinyl transferase